MNLSDAGLREQPFGAEGHPLTVVPYAAFRLALDFLDTTFRHPTGLGLFQGPPLSGKSTILRHYGDERAGDRAVALVDGGGIDTSAFLQELLSQFGYDLQFDSLNELLNMLRVFIQHQAGTGRPPLLIVENTHAMNPGTLATLCDLVALEVRDESALRLVLASDRSLAAMMRAPALGRIAERLTGSFSLEPLVVEETSDYVHAKLRAAGCPAPETVVPSQLGAELHAASGGWPGVLDRLLRAALEKAEKCPVGTDHIEPVPLPENVPTLVDGADYGMLTNGRHAPPMLYVTHNGETLREIKLDRPRLLVGRSDHNDLRISSRFISRHHALFVRHGDSTFLMDLNSTNGTFVNSRRISNLMLKNDDIVLVGNHRIKFVDPAATERKPLDDAGFTETLVMQNLEDIRRLLARESMEAAAGVDSQQAGSA